MGLHRRRTLRPAARVRRLCRPPPMVGHRPRDVLGCGHRRARGPVARPARAGARRWRPLDAGCSLVPRRHAQLRRARPRRRARPGGRGGGGGTEPDPARERADVGRARRVGRRVRRGAADARGARGRRRRRLRAEHPRDPDRVPRHRVDRGGVDELCTRVRHPLGHRPARPARAGGAARHRRVPLRVTGGRSPRRGRHRASRPARAARRGVGAVPRRTPARQRGVGRGVPVG